MRRQNANKTRPIRTLLYAAAFVSLLLLASAAFDCRIHDLFHPEPVMASSPAAPAVPSSQADPVEAPPAAHAAPDMPAFLSAVPEPDGTAPSIVINGNLPFFSAEDKLRTDAFELYSDLDDLNRCGPAYANVCPDLMPTDAREQILETRPTGWSQAKYPELIDREYLWNRCHLIGFQLAGENSNEKNLITGTRYLNVVGMLELENRVASYVRKTKNHVLYRVTPVFAENELVARGVLMEAYSVEDRGSLQFCVFCFNIQPGVEIDYRTGESRVARQGI